MTEIAATRKEQEGAPAPEPGKPALPGAAGTKVPPRQARVAGGCDASGKNKRKGRRLICPDKPELPGAVISDKFFIPHHASSYGLGNARPRP